MEPPIIFKFHPKECRYVQIPFLSMPRNREAEPNPTLRMARQPIFFFLVSTERSTFWLLTRQEADIIRGFGDFISFFF